MAAGARPDSRKKISRRFTLPGPQPPMPAKTSGLDIITIKVLRVRLNADTFDSSMKGKACHPAATPLPTVWVRLSLSPGGCQATQAIYRGIKRCAAKSFVGMSNAG